MRFIHGFACAVALFLFAPPFQAQNPQWFEVSSGHFLLFTDTSAVKGRRLLEDLESRVSVLEKTFGAVPRRQFPIEVFLFKRVEDFTEVVTAGPDATIDKSAYLLKGPDRLFVAARDKSPEVIANDVGHALGHVFFERFVWWRPFWLAEGAAELFRTIGREPDKRKVSPEEELSASELMKAAPSATYRDADPAPVFRVEAYRLLRIVIEEQPAAFGTYLETLRTEGGAEAKLALENPDALTERLFRDAETRINPAAVSSDIRVQNADSANLAIHRGDLLLAANKTSEASRWYNADTAQARAARAILTRFSRSVGEATRALDRAARELPEAGLVQFHFGSIEAQAAGDQALQTTALERAVKLLPQMGRVHAELARLYTLAGNGDAAVPLLDRALQLEPEYADRFYALRAEALLALRRFDEARKAIQAASALPHGDRSAVEAYDRKVTALSRRIEEIRRQAEGQQTEQLRAEVAARAAALEPPKPVVPPPPVRYASINYQIEGTVKAEVIEPVMFPNYPDALVQNKTAGKVTLQVNVGANGRVTQATVVGSQIPEMNAASIDAVKKWSFKPVLRAGQPAPFTIKLVFEYVSR